MRTFPTTEETQDFVSSAHAVALTNEISGAIRLTTLEDKIARLAQQFALDVMNVVRSASISELAGAAASTQLNGASTRARSASTPAAPKKAKRVKVDHAEVASRIVALLKTAPGGMRGEDIRKSLELPRNVWLKAIGLALADKRVKKTGEKRSTVYTIGGQAKPVSKPKPKKVKAKAKKAAPKKSGNPSRRRSKSTKAKPDPVKTAAEEGDDDDQDETPPSGEGE